jgi:adenosylmethionine-8-amino-7-oxononanoate aminotransferase
MLTHPRGYLKGLADRCEARGIPLIVDEVATGFGRTGTVFACEQEEVTPDFLCLAKGITGGYLPLAATLTSERIYDAFLGERRELKHFFHGHTYTANPLACAAAIASLDLVLENRDRIAALPLRLQAALDRLDSRHILEIRGVGSMIGIELGPFAWDRFVGAQVCEHARAHGVILRPLGDVIVWMPPLSITDDEIDLLARGTEAAIHEVLD